MMLYHSRYRWLLKYYYLELPYQKAACLKQVQRPTDKLSIGRNSPTNVYWNKVTTEENAHKINKGGIVGCLFFSFQTS